MFFFRSNRGSYQMAGKGSGGKAGSGKGGGSGYHSAVTGKFVTPSYAKSHPNTTARVTNKPTSGGKKGK
jgi:hypothetical protein